jgi:predicted DNA-binding transcriptional regulator YafY
MQQATVHEDGSLTLRVPYADATELAMEVLRHGEQVRVASPALLASLVRTRLREAAERYV